LKKEIYDREAKIEEVVEIINDEKLFEMNIAEFLKMIFK
jgi:hypothetical protein